MDVDERLDWLKWAEGTCFKLEQIESIRGAAFGVNH
jgi:hypothetical protein